LIDEDMLEKLKSEMSVYKTRAKMCSSFNNRSIQEQLIKIVDFWRPKDQATKTWRKFAHICFLVRSSSDSVERAFSILKNVYGTNMTSSLVDLTRVKLMLRFNNSTPKPKSFRGSIQMREGVNNDDGIGDEAIFDEDDDVVVMDVV